MQHHSHVFEVTTYTTYVTLILLAVISMYWVCWNVFTAAQGIRAKWHKRQAARRVQRELAGYLIITGTPVRRRRALRCSAR